MALSVRKKQVRLFEVGPRDGLQNEKHTIPTRDKVTLVNLLSAAGLLHIEVSSFVSPRWIPQLADAAQVFNDIDRVPGVSYGALVPNIKGLERAIRCHVDEVAVFAAASETFSQKNINCSIAESLERFEPVIRDADAAGLPVRGYISCVVACPYEGPVQPQKTREVAERLLEMGCYEVSLGDTIGRGTTETIAVMLDAVIPATGAERLAGHYHDTGGLALKNIEASLDRGLRSFDSAVAGLGGCPYAPGAKGNVSTRAVADMLAEIGYATGVDLKKLTAAERFAAQLKGDDHA